MSDATGQQPSPSSDEWTGAESNVGDNAPSGHVDAPQMATTEVAPAALENLVADELAGESPSNLETILEIPVTMSMEVGQTHISIRNLLQLNQGSVVELDRVAGEPLDVLVNGTLVAHGEVVVINEKFGIRVTDVISAQERVRKLR